MEESHESSHDLLNILKLNRILYGEWVARGKGRSRKASEEAPRWEMMAV